MRRREFIAGLGSAATWPLAARAQQTTVPVVGYLSPQSGDYDYKYFTVPFLQGLKETGYVEGQNVAVEYRWAEGQYNRLPALAADLVRRRPAVIVANTSPATQAAQAATTTIPIVWAAGEDPVALGLIAPGIVIANRPVVLSRVSPKRLQLIRELLPNAARFGVLADPANVDIQFFIADLEVAARTLGLQLVVVNASTDSDLEPAFATFSQQHVGAVLVGHSAFYSRRMEQLAALAARHALPAIYTLREYALAGGLISYGSGQGYFYHQLGIYAGRILKGEKLTDLNLGAGGAGCIWSAQCGGAWQAVQRITKIDLVINLKTAKALGLTIPETLLATADEVIR